MVQRLKIVQVYFANSSSPLATARALRAKYGGRNAHSNSKIFVISTIICHIFVKEKLIVQQISRPFRLGLKLMTTSRLALALHPYKIMLGEKLMPTEHFKRRSFAD